MQGNLVAPIAKSPAGDLTYLVTEYGRPFTATAAANRKRLAGEGARLLASDQIANIDCPTEKRATI